MVKWLSESNPTSLSGKQQLERHQPARCGNETRKISFGNSIWSADLAAVGPWPSRATARTKP
jgi:hypothetical protein